MVTIYRYINDADLLSVLSEQVIDPAEAMVAKIRNT